MVGDQSEEGKYTTANWSTSSNSAIGPVSQLHAVNGHLLTRGPSMLHRFSRIFRFCWSASGRSVTYLKLGLVSMSNDQPRKTTDVPLCRSREPIAGWWLSGIGYSITSSARARIEGGTVRPSAFAVFKLNTSSNLVGCSIGRSAGFAPLRILSTNTVRCLGIEEIFIP